MNGKAEPYILFELAGTTYAVSGMVVQQVEMVENITPVPNTAPYIEGVMFSRGHVIPVLNLRVRLGLERKERDAAARIIVVKNEERIAGLMVDSAREFMNLPGDSMQPPPEFVSGKGDSFLKGIIKLDKRVILIFNVEQLMTREEKQILTN
jgi:purine-binding chemotaxis protein CheW